MRYELIRRLTVGRVDTVSHPDISAAKHRGVATHVAVAVLGAVAYFAGARIGYAFAIPHAFVTLWPPAGITLALLMLFRRRYWPAILAGAIAGSLVSDLRSGYSVPLAIAASMANVAESILAAWVVTRRVGSPVRLSTVRNV